MAYGYSELSGVFLSVFDKRLMYDENATKEVNAVSEAIGVKDGGGSYFDLHTGLAGFGFKVDDKTMATFLKRYGVTDEQVRSLPLQLEIEATHVETVRSPGECDVCGCDNSTKKCSACRKVNYCSKECQTKAWRAHSIFCKLPFIINGEEDDNIQALFLPEKEDTPQLVYLPLVSWRDEDGWYKRLDGSEYIDGMTGTFRSDFFPKQDPNWQAAYHILYKDYFGEDAVSTENRCLRNISERVAKGVFGDQRSMHKGSRHLNRGPPIHFKGNLLVVKAEKTRGAFLGGAATNYLSVKPTDMYRISNLLYQANLSYSTGY